jgi:UDP-N-acetyl-D-mannosaminuronic acid transferase (WecB/TagA/CpsF family)
LVAGKDDYSMQVTIVAEPTSTIRTKQVLGIRFFDGTVEEAVAYISSRGGLVIAPAAPSMIALQYDEEYRRAVSDADLAIADSGWMVVFWRLLRGEQLHRISGLIFFKRLLEQPECREPGKVFWILPSEAAKKKTLDWSQGAGFPTTSDDCYVAPRYRSCSRGSVSRVGQGTEKNGAEFVSGAREERGSQSRDYSIQDETLLAIVRQRQPKHIIVAIGGGMQDKIGSYLKHNCGYRPGIHCIGAAPGFVTGDQIRIPMWADRFYLGWLFRVFAQPRVYFKRYWKARMVARLILRYGKEMPPLIGS